MIYDMKSLNSLHSTLFITAFLTLFSCLYLSQTSSIYNTHEASSFLGDSDHSCKAIVSAEAGKLRPSSKYHTETLIDEEVFQVMEEIDRKEISFNVAEEDHTQFWLHKNANGDAIKTKHSVVIYHGLWNSPSWTKWLAKKAFEMGFNVINVRLPKHNHARRSDLNRLTKEDFISQTALMVNLAEAIGEKVVYLGHSAGGNSAIHSALIGMDRTSGLIGLGTALQLRSSTYWSSFILGRSFITNIPINWRNERFGRYRSLGAGRATHYFAEHLREWIGGRDFRGLIDDLRRVNFLQIEVENDGTINSEVNIEVGEASNSDLHVMSNQLAHVDMLREAGYFEEGTVQAVEMAKIEALIVEFLNKLE